MNLWEHERVLASAHSSVHVNKLNMMQRQLRGMEEKAAVVEKRSQVALREELARIERLEAAAGVSLYENEKNTIRWRLSRLSLEVSKQRVENESAALGAARRAREAAGSRATTAASPTRQLGTSYLSRISSTGTLPGRRARATLGLEEGITKTAEGVGGGGGRGRGSWGIREASQVESVSSRLKARAEQENAFRWKLNKALGEESGQGERTGVGASFDKEAARKKAAARVANVRAMKSAAGSGESPMVFAARLVAARPKNAGNQEDFPTHSAYSRQRAAAGRPARVGARTSSEGSGVDGGKVEMRTEGTEHEMKSPGSSEREDGRLVHSMRPGRLSSGPETGEENSACDSDDDQGGDDDGDDDDGRDLGGAGFASRMFMPEPDGARRPLSRGAVKRTGATDFLEQARKELRAKQSMAPPAKAKSDASVCNICWEELTPMACVTTDCDGRHSFCRQCIGVWLANAQGGGRCPCCRQLVHLLFHSVATFVNPEDEMEKPQLVVQPMSVASLVDELGRQQQQQQQQQRREQPGRHQTALNGPQRRLGAMTRRPAFPALRSSASVTFQSPMSPEGDRARWFDAGAVGGETMRVMFATTQERRNQSSGEVDEWTSGSDQD